MNFWLYVLRLVLSSFFIIATLQAVVTKQSTLSVMYDADCQNYLLPLNHPLKPALDEIFGNERVTRDLLSLSKAGFKILYEGERSYIVIASHPKLPGHLVKLYLDVERRIKRDVPGWKWLLRRCQGADAVRQAIKKIKSKHFSAPQKWLYQLPYMQGYEGRPFVLLVEDMQLVSEEENEQAWKTLMTKEHLNELYQIIKRARGTSYRKDNIWLSKNGTFAFIDTEYPYRNPNFEKLGYYLASAQREYWHKIVKKGESSSSKTRSKKK